MTQYCQDYTLSFNIYMIRSCFFMFPNNSSLVMDVRPFFLQVGLIPIKTPKQKATGKLPSQRGSNRLSQTLRSQTMEEREGKRKGTTTNMQLLQPPQIALLLELEQQKRGEKNNSEKKGLCLSSPQNHSSCSGRNPFTQSRPVSQTQI